MQFYFQCLSINELMMQYSRYKKAASRENLSSGFPTRSVTNQDVQPQNISDLGSRGIVLSL